MTVLHKCCSEYNPNNALPFFNPLQLFGAALAPLVGAEVHPPTVPQTKLEVPGLRAPSPPPVSFKN